MIHNVLIARKKTKYSYFPNLCIVFEINVIFDVGYLNLCDSLELILYNFSGIGFSCASWKLWTSYYVNHPVNCLVVGIWCELLCNHCWKPMEPCGCVRLSPLLRLGFQSYIDSPSWDLVGCQHHVGVYRSKVCLFI